MQLQNAWNLVSKGKYREAEELFEQAEQTTQYLSWEYKIMKGWTKFHLDKDQECFALLSEAWNELQNDQSISEADRDYLKLYIFDCLNVYDENGVFDISTFEAISPASVRLENVSKRWKTRFPIRDHPDWSIHGIGPSVTNTTLH